MLQLSHDQYELLQSFVTMPDPTHAEMFALQAEVDDLTESLEVKTSEFESLELDLEDAESDKKDLQGRINELEAALADALSYMQESLGGDVKAFDNKEFARLWGIL